ncbi:MAG: DUF4097 family beta strand repeat-containing protein [Lachnospiraceae bacterium]|nr:DUF4097 family beta strand repeat-containing protein [Lachnospiraceae bacterium]MDE7029114.1 DUF4097 family beta strand repeat-containing protein [Lachnospiraceae bacterium]
MKTEKNMVTNTFAADAIKRLKLRTAAAAVNVRKAHGGMIRVVAENLQDEDYTCEVCSDTLAVIYDVRHVRHFVSLNHKEVRITLYLPEELVFEHIDLQVGAGEAVMKDVPISCQDMEVEIGAGEWRAAQLTVAGTLDVQVGAGRVRMKRADVGSLQVECSVGNIVFKGAVQSDIRVECGMGSCRFELENKESDFNYDISCAVGSVKVNGSGGTSFGSKKIYSNQNARGTAVLECGIGSIVLNTGSGAAKKVSLSKTHT